MTESAEKTVEQTMERVREYQRTLEAFSRIGAERLPPERLMHHVAAQVSRVTHIERTKVMRYRRESGDLLVEAGVGWKEGIVGQATLAVDHRSPAGHALQTATPVVIEDIMASNEFRCPDMLRDERIVSLLNVPVMVNGQTWGVLEIDSVRRTLFDEWDISFLATVANMMGTSLAYHDTQQKGIEALAQKTREREQFDIALRELQHRVKNNLQIIVAFLSLKMRESTHETREKLQSVMGRVQCIALAHDLLSAGNGVSSVEFSDYLRALCANIAPPHSEVKIQVHAEPGKIPIDRAVPAGLVVNELVTNAIKYAFDNSGGHIRVAFSAISHASEACVTVEDDGRGLGAAHKKGLGLNLVEKLAQQIQGRVDYPKPEVGTKVVLCFPVAL